MAANPVHVLSKYNKLFGDTFIEADPKGGPGFVVIPSYNDFQNDLTSQLVGVGQSGRDPFIVDIAGGLGLLARNLGITVHGFDSRQFGLADKIHRRDPRDVRELDLDFLW